MSCLFSPWIHVEILTDRYETLRTVFISPYKTLENESCQCPPGIGK